MLVIPSLGISVYSSSDSESMSMLRRASLTGEALSGGATPLSASSSADGIAVPWYSNRNGEGAVIGGDRRAGGDRPGTCVVRPRGCFDA